MASLILCFRRVNDHHDLLHHSPLLKNTGVRHVVLDKWFPPIVGRNIHLGVKAMSQRNLSRLNHGPFECCQSRVKTHFPENYQTALYWAAAEVHMQSCTLANHSVEKGNNEALTSHIPTVVHATCIYSCLRAHLRDAPNPTESRGKRMAHKFRLLS